MNKSCVLGGLLLPLLVSCAAMDKPSPAEPEPSRPDYVLVIHGGAGTIRRDKMDADTEQAYRQVLSQALSAGASVLDAGGVSLDAVEKAIRVMEDSPLFNAGKGAVFTHSGKNELDASIMNGADQSAGAVAGVTTIRNPISAARAVMERSPHVMLSGRGAEAFAQQAGIDRVEPDYFFTQRRWDSLQRLLEKEAKEMQLDHDDPYHGTVGAVALDRQGNLAAGTSTGGMTNKRWGRVGDSPVIAAGTYADNELGCAVSATGHGEYFIRYAVAHDICARAAYRQESIEQAAGHVVLRKLKEKGGDGGVIAIDGEGNIAMPFNTQGMYRGWQTNSASYVGIYADE